MLWLPLLWLLPVLTAGAADSAFVNVSVISMQSDAVTAAQTVVIRDGRIIAIGNVDNTALPDDAMIIDGTDRYLMPGLAEMHGHVPDVSSPDLQRVLTLWVANGVTSVRGMLGQPSHLQLREQLERGEILGPRLVTAGPSFNGSSVAGPRQATAMVQQQQASGYDFLKIHPGLTRGEFVAIADTADKAGIRFAGHVPADVGLELALERGMSTIDHLDGYMQTLIAINVDPTGGIGGFFGVSLANIADPGRIPDMARATVAAGTWNVPTQTLFENVVGADSVESLQNRPEMKYMPASTVAEWAAAKRDITGDADFDAAVAERAIDIRRRLILELQSSGAGLLLGSDAPQIFNVPGYSAHRELGLLVASGLTPYQALTAGTTHAAAWFGAGSERGAIAVGLQADLVLLDDNPLQNIANSRRVHGVMLRGRWLDRAMLDKLLERYARST